MIPALKIMRPDHREDVDGSIRLGLRFRGIFLRQRLLFTLLTTVLGDLTHRTGRIRERLRHGRADGALPGVLDRHLGPGDDLQEVPRQTGRSQPRHEGEPGERPLEASEHVNELAPADDRAQIN